MFLTTSVPLRCVPCNGHVGEIQRAYAFCGLTISNGPME